jgi:hypothetical protein
VELDNNFLFLKGRDIISATLEDQTLVLQKDGGGSFSVDLSFFNPDIYNVSGVYDPNTGTVTFETNSGQTFQVTGFVTGQTNYYTTNITLTNNVLSFDRTDTSDAYSVDLTPLGQSGSTLIPLIFNNGVPNTNIIPSFGVNTIIGSDFSVINGGQNNLISGLTNTHIIGSNITATTSNTTHVNNLNIYDTPITDNTIGNLLVRDTDGTVKIREVTSISGVTTSGATLGSIPTKFAVTLPFVENVTQTIVHGFNLDSGEVYDIIVQLRDVDNNEEIGGAIDNFQSNEVDITLSQNFDNVRVVIIG